MGFNKLNGIAEQPAKADKSAPTGFRGICLKPIIGGVRDNAVSKNNADYEIGLCAARASSIIHFNF